MTKVKKIIAVIAGIFVAAAFFMGGFLCHKFTRDAGVSSYEWALKTIEKNYVGDYTSSGYAVLDVSKYSSAELAIKGLVSNLDPYSTYYTAEEYDAVLSDNSGRKSGVGISFNFAEGRGVYIVTVVGNSPAYKSGLRSGDTVLSGSYGGRTVEFNSQKAFTDFIDGVKDDDEFTFVTDRGERVMRRSEYTASYTCMYTNNTVFYFSAEKGETLKLSVAASTEMSYLPDGTAYIWLSQFFGSAASEFGWLMENFKARNCTSLILDLRSNGGGYLDVMQDIGGCFTSNIKGKSVATVAKYKKGSDTFYCANTPDYWRFNPDAKLYVLANSGTASASEALIGVLVSYGFLKYENIYLSKYSDEYLDAMNYTGTDRAARTYGKGIMQSTFRNYKTREALKLTTAKLYWQNGKCIHGVGLRESDGCKAVETDWVVTSGDRELRKVVQMIAG